MAFNEKKGATYNTQAVDPDTNVTSHEAGNGMATPKAGSLHRGLKPRHVTVGLI
jgi:hypothetical protein